MINWDTPKKIRSTEDHNRVNSSDCGVPGTYVPNMSMDDQRAWKGKHINKGKVGERIELRKTFDTCGNYAQVLVVLSDEGFDKNGSGVGFPTGKERGNIKISANGKLEMTYDEWDELKDVISVAKSVMGQ